MQNIDLGTIEVNDTTLSEWIYTELQTIDNISQNFATMENINYLLNNPQLFNFLDATLVRYIEGILHGHDVYISHHEIMDFIHQNEETVYNVTGFRMEQDDYEIIETFLIENEISEMTRLDTLLPDISDVISPSMFVLSPAMLWLLAVAMVLLTVVIFFILKRRVRATLMCDAATVCISGVIFAAVFRAVGNLIAEAIPFDIDRRLIESVLSGIQSRGMATGIAAAGIGILTIFVLAAIEVIASK